jgi:hypothetical protein
MERKDVEKNRRLHMKGLCLKLSSLIPPSAAKHASLLSAPAPCSKPNKVLDLFFLFPSRPRAAVEERAIILALFYSLSASRFS